MWPFRNGVGTSTCTLPLFPLRTVLFPGGLLPLKVFEQRYVEMTKACMMNSRPFGVCLITQGDEVATPGGTAPQIASIGTLARITDWDVPQVGILHLATVGEGRFQVRKQSVQANGLVVGEVTPIAAEASLPLGEAHKPLADLLELIASRVGPRNFPSERNFGDASWVGYRLAELLPLPLTIKQSMLEINDAAVRLTVLQKFLSEQGLL
jgi:Lon protease-like protein